MRRNLLVGRLVGRLGGRSILVVLNTAVAAAASVVLLLGAARAMDKQSLSDFSLVQLIVVTAVMLQRSTILSPALAAQRSTGRTQVPLGWIGTVSLPAAFCVALGLSFAFGAQGAHATEWFIAGLLSCGAALVQDTVRYILLSRDLSSVAVISDGAWLLLVSAIIFFPAWFADPLILTIYWGATGLFSTGVGLIQLLLHPSGIRVGRRSRSRDFRAQATIRQTWRLGKWSGIDALLSATATLAPMLFTAFILDSADAGIYRVLQSALGPINILCTSMITLFGLNSWRLTTTVELTALRSKVSRAVLAMTGFTVAYVAVAELVMIWISGISSPELLRIAVIVGVVGIVGSATSPLSAAALALGYQRHGALLRLVIVVFALSASLAGALGLWLPWNDPIGTVLLFAAGAGLVGWFLSFRAAMARESRLVGAVSGVRV